MVHSFDTSLKNVAALYIKLLRVKVTASTIEEDIQENPFYPSLLSLSAAFGKYRINNYAFSIGKDDLAQLQGPFVAFLRLPGIGKDFVLVTGMTGKTVTYLYKNRKPTTMTNADFLKIYEGVIWIAEPDGNSGEADYDNKLKREKAAKNRKMAWIAGLSALLLFAVRTNAGTAGLVAYASITLVKFAGMAVSILLLVYETDKSNVFVRNICSAGGKTNCDAVLSSKASRVMGISWGEIGFIYFAATTAWILLPFIPFADKVLWVAIANLFAAPYILFSIYYQWRVIKQWCPLCLTVQAVLLAELVWSMVNYWFAPLVFRPDPQSFQFIFPCILLPILAWYGLKPFFARARDFRLYKAGYKRLQHNPDIFHGLLQQQTAAPDGWQELGITIGNPAASHTIIKVCNPYCGPCARAHPVLEGIVAKNNNIKLRIIFTTRKKENDIETTVVKHLLAIAAEENGKKTRQSLDDWYLADRKLYDNFSEKYPSTGELDYQGVKIDAMRKWCEEAEIRYTPTIFVNGRRLPENYDLEELRNIL